MSLKARIARLEARLSPVEPPAEEVVRDFTDDEIEWWADEILREESGKARPDLELLGWAEQVVKSRAYRLPEGTLP
jgi:hypothetical protein